MEVGRTLDGRKACVNLLSAVHSQLPRYAALCLCQVSAWAQHFCQQVYLTKCSRGVGASAPFSSLLATSDALRLAQKASCLCSR